MASPRTLARVQALVWVLVYAGMLTAILGLAVLRTGAPLGWHLFTLGCLLALAGIGLIYVRSLLKETHEPK